MDYSIDDWCAGRKISRSMFYKLRKAGNAPRITKIGTRSIILAEDDANWRREQLQRANNASEAA